MNGPTRVPEETYREQTVEIALGPKGAFENGNSGAVKRRVRSERVIRAAPRIRRPPKPPPEPRTPRVVALLRRAIEWRRQLGAGEIESQAAIARREGVTRARVTQVMAMLQLPLELQHRIQLARPTRRHTLTEHALRRILKLSSAEQEAALIELEAWS